MKKVRVVVYGIGVEGSGMVRMMLDKDWIEIVGGICRAYPDPKDASKVKAGKDLGEVVGVGRNLGIIVSDDPDAVLAQTKPDIMLHATTFSSQEEVEAQILKALEAGVNVISLVDSRLLYPWAHWPEFGRGIDEAAKKNGVTFLETGINPGFSFDLIPIFFTGVCASVRKITASEVMDVSPVGTAVLEWLRFGITVSEFQERLADKTSYYVFARPFDPRVDMIADALGWKLDETRLTLEPMTSNKRKRALYGMEIEPGLVCGVRQLYQGMKGGEAVITTSWDLIVYPEEEGLEQGNYVSIEGEPNINIVIKGMAEKEDVATYAHAVNHIPQVMEARPGLVTVRDLPIAIALK